VRELENTLQRAAALCNTDVLLPTDIPLGSNTQRSSTPILTLTRMQDALQTLLQGAQILPDFELMPWVERELKKMALRNCQQDKEQAERLLGAPIVASVKTEPVPVADGAAKNGKAAAKTTKARKAS
jgi:DNA-binding NtrC family response regulator